MRRWFSLLFCIVLVLTLPITALAHPGRTDSSGGHTDRSTGEYHYHHGYSAHDHYDMDGDGDLDCPHDFNDAAGSRSGSSSRSGTASNNYSASRSTAETVVVYQDREVIKEVPYVPKWIKWILVGMGLLCLFLFLSRRKDKEDIECLEKNVKWQEEEKIKLKEHFEAEAKKAAEDYEIRIFKLKSDHSTHIKKVVSDKDKIISSLRYENESVKKELRSVISDIPVGEVFYPNPGNPDKKLYKITIPNDVYFVEGDIPVKGVVTSYKPYGDYTVFVTRSSTIYHDLKNCSGSFGMEPMHLFDAMSIKRSCRRCGKPHGDVPPEWYMQLIALKNIAARTNRK